MERSSLKHLFNELAKTMSYIEGLKDNLTLSKTSTDKAHYKRTLELQQSRANYLSNKIDNFGGKGESLIIVTGIRKVESTKNNLTWDEKFVYYLQGMTEDEARLLMKAQAIQNNLIESSLDFQTIEFRKYFAI